MFESFENRPQLENLGNQLDKPKINEAEMKEQCCDVVRDFYNKGLDSKYTDAGVKYKMDILNNFFYSIKDNMGIDSIMQFEKMDNLGQYDRYNDTISLNINYLNDIDPEDALKTILHESRHAFQQKAIDDPAVVDIPESKINEWEYDFDNYKQSFSAYDFEEYATQSVEVDANDFADEIMNKGFDSNNYLTNLA